MTPKSQKRQQTKRPDMRTLSRWALTACVWMVIGGLGLLAYYAMDLPNVDDIAATPRRPGITIVSRQGLTIATQGDLYGAAVQARQVPESLINAIIATEDRRFYNHFGIDVWGLARAMLANIKAGRIVQGGSTLTQQVAKNLFLTSQRTLKRKAQEAMLAIWLERKFSKDQILTMYLNRVYLGAGAYGVEAASRRYFGKGAKDLSLYQSALIAGLLKAPTRYSPANNRDLSNKRTHQVLLNMVSAGFLSQDNADTARAGGVGWTAIKTDSRHSGRHFTDWVMDQIPSYIGRIDRDLIVTTTLDLTLQRQAETALSSTLNGPGEKANVGQGAIVVLSPEGAVRTMVGGKDYGQSQFNRATQAQRQPGSAFKPFVYLTAIEMGLSPDYRLFDEPVDRKSVV